MGRDCAELCVDYMAARMTVSVYVCVRTCCTELTNFVYAYYIAMCLQVANVSVAVQFWN